MKLRTTNTDFSASYLIQMSELLLVAERQEPEPGLIAQGFIPLISPVPFFPPNS